MDVIIVAVLCLKHPIVLERLLCDYADTKPVRSSARNNPRDLVTELSRMLPFFLILTGFVFFIILSSPATAYDLTSLISTDDPFYEPVAACHYIGIIYSEGGSDVRLEQSLNRYQVAHITILTLETLGYSVNKDTTAMTYHDIPASHWAIEDVAGCVNLGLMGGFEDLTFQGRSNMLKEHWLAMSSVIAVKFAPEPTPEFAQEPPKFRDLPTINWLWQPINTLAKYGWLDPSVMDDDFLNRNDTVTRKIIYWYLGRLILSVKGPVDTWSDNVEISGSKEHTDEIQIEESTE